MPGRGTGATEGYKMKLDCISTKTFLAGKPFQILLHFHSA
jgi:hypothetical protein